jgi:AcrR family transcriptional regulator
VTAATAEGAQPRRGRGRPGYDLESVLQTAVEVFNERGYDGASMEDLSRRLGIAKSAIYHHVSGKEELLRMALDRALDGWAEAAERARELDAPAIERLEMLVRGTVAVLETRLLSGMINSIVEWYRPGSRQAGRVSLADAVCPIAFDGLRVKS